MNYTHKKGKEYAVSEELAKHFLSTFSGNLIKAIVEYHASQEQKILTEEFGNTLSLDSILNSS